LPNHQDISVSEWRSNGHSLTDIYLGKVPEFLLKIAKAEDLIANLSQIYIENSLLITVQEKARPEYPLQIMHINFPQHPQKVDAALANIFISLKRDAKTQIIETHVSADTDKMTFSNTMYRIDLAAGAELKHYTLQCEGQRAQHFAASNVNVAESAKYESLLYQAGSQLGRHELKVKLNGAKAQAKLFGLYYGRAQQQLDQITTIEHLVPDTESSQYYKGMMADASRAVFSGKIVVAEQAKNTVARQLSRNLLLDKDAEINAKPELQISNNDVTCSHGASVGELDQDLLFYLQSRCIAPIEARAMLARAFANEIIDKIDLPKVKHFVNQHLDQSMLSTKSQEAAHVH
jgi:Fe-S cluster assembly protein SufD